MPAQGKIYLEKKDKKVIIAESASEGEVVLIYAATEIIKSELPAVESDVISVFNIPSTICIDTRNLLKMIEINKTAYLGYGMGKISSKNPDAAEKAMKTLLCVAENFNNIENILVNICANPKQLTMSTVNDSLTYIYKLIPEETRIYFGQQFNENLDNCMRILLILLKNTEKSHKLKPEYYAK